MKSLRFLQSFRRDFCNIPFKISGGSLTIINSAVYEDSAESHTRLLDRFLLSFGKNAGEFLVSFRLISRADFLKIVELEKQFTVLWKLKVDVIVVPAITESA